MSIFSVFNAEPASAKFAVQMLSAFNSPAAIFDRTGTLKFANPEWRTNIKGVQFESIFSESGSKECIFRLGKAVRHNKALSEKLNDSVVQVSPLGKDSLVRCLAPNHELKTNFDENKDTQTQTLVALEAKPLIESEISTINEVQTISQANLASLIKGAPLGIARLSRRNIIEAQIIGTNPAFERISGILSGGDLKSLVRDEDFSSLQKLEIGQTLPIELVMRNNPSTICEAWLLEDGEKAAALLLIDISDRREMEARLNQANKMEVIGKIASEVAHELNNLLTVIVLNTDTLLMRHPVGDPSYHELQGIRNTTGRAGNLVSTLLAFSRKQTMRREVLDIGAILTEFSYLLHQVLDERVKFDIKHGRDLPPILADKQQLETMFMNLVTNARDAVISHNPNGGIVKVSTERVNRQAVIDALAGKGVADVPDCDYCKIAVSDNGTGMPKEVAEKIFEPFFTTKESGKGTGIGMASVYGIVKQTGGFITIDTEVGKGTRFCVFFPQTDEVAPIEVKAIEPVQAKRANNLSGQGRILLVEDEDGLRSITAQILKQRGYSVTEAGDGEEALEYLMENPDSFDLLISDVVMPIMDGPTLLREAKPYLGHARVIFMSGYAEQDFGQILEKDRAISFLPKPFELVQLAERVKQELSAV